MWRARGARGGQTVEVPLREIDRVISRQDLLSEARSFFAANTNIAIDTIARDLNSAELLPGIDGIEVWGERAAELIGRPQYVYFLKWPQHLRAKPSMV